MTVALGLRANWRQFSLLVVVNAFVGAMVGLERSVLPVIATREFAVASTTAALSFIATFGLAKALTNLAAGWLADQDHRRRTLLAGWLVALPVPFLILVAPNWWWIVAANALLGVNQGLAWSATVIMKIDLVGPARRGFAMGINECAGYLAVALAGVVSGVAAATYGLRVGVAYPGMIIALAGLALSAFVRDTSPHVRTESGERDGEVDGNERPPRPSLRTIIAQSLGRNANLLSVSQAGLINNLNDGLAWGLFPLLFAGSGLNLTRLSVLVGVYPATWALFQLVTGPLSDRVGRKLPIVAGMLVQAAALITMASVTGELPWTAALVALGVGTALVYPALLAAVGDIAHPAWRGAAVGVYRLWRDLGYVAGAIVAGVLTDAFGASTAIRVVGLLTAASGLVVALRLKESGVVPVAEPSIGGVGA